MPSPTIASIIGGLLPSIYNPNLVSEESSRQVSLAEVEAIAMTASLVGYDPAVADGVFTFGGTGTILYAAKIGLEKAVPDVRRHGLHAPAVIVCSDRAHYACRTVANWLGIGEQNVVQVPTRDDNQMDTSKLLPTLRDICRSGRAVACIVATMGTTPNKNTRVSSSNSRDTKGGIVIEYVPVQQTLQYRCPSASNWF